MTVIRKKRVTERRIPLLHDHMLSEETHTYNAEKMSIAVLMLLPLELIPLLQLLASIAVLKGPQHPTAPNVLRVELQSSRSAAVV